MTIQPVLVRRLLMILAFVAFIIALVVARDWVHEPGKTADVLAFLALGGALETAAFVPLP
jgi:hypothetical protein